MPIDFNIVWDHKFINLTPQNGLNYTRRFDVASAYRKYTTTEEFD